MDDKTKRKALIYARTATTGQDITPQVERAKTYASEKGYEVIATITDKGVSGETLDRSGVKELLTLLEQHQENSPVVVVDDPARLSRNVKDYARIREVIQDTGSDLDCLSVSNDGSPEARFIENIVIARRVFEAELEEQEST